MSWYEVESKIHVKDPKALREKLEKLGTLQDVQEKRDVYYSLPGPKPPKQKLRIRDKGDEIQVNYKKSYGYKDGVHAKKETEFTVSDKRNFIELIEHFGFKQWISKYKKTELYVIQKGFNLELNYVEGLGWYLEIEILCREKDIEHARKEIVKIREKLGLSMKDVEKVGYTRELWAKKRSKK